MWENFYEKISNIINDGKKIAIATVVKTCGSSPASSGQQIAVSDDKTCFATVGGGASEAKVIEKCLQMIKDGSKVEQFFIDHNIEGMSCGGSMSLFINVIGNDNNLFIFGGGHIAQSLSKIAKSCDFNVNVIEDRGDFEQYFEDVNFNIMNTDEYRENIKLEDSSYVVICTRGHKEDEKALEFALTQNPKYIGMIGSKKKGYKNYAKA